MASNRSDEHHKYCLTRVEPLSADRLGALVG